MILYIYYLYHQNTYFREIRFSRYDFHGLFYAMNVQKARKFDNQSKSIY